MLTKDRAVSPATHIFNPQVNCTTPAFTSQLQRIAAPRQIYLSKNCPKLHDSSRQQNPDPEA